ncbi:MAG: PUA domain-containing protein, partial [Zhaonellaceae bacterium]
AENGKSLLPAGITKVEGDFEPGNVVGLWGPEGLEFARGIVNYCSDDIKKILGKNTQEIQSILGHKDYDEVIHRDNLVVK